jgi:hypothetical protein
MMAADPARAGDVRKTLFFYLYGNAQSYCQKYSHYVQDPASTSTSAVFMEDNILIFRLADMYLLRAEALAKQNKGALAVVDLNLIRSKAGVPAYTGATDRASMMKAIFNERAIEFMGEAQSAYDRIRMDYFYEGVAWMNLDRINRKGYFWPIAASIISTNPSIIQNEFWRGKI